MMKNKALLFLATLASLSAYSASVTINVATEGTLEQVLSEQSVTNVTELTITGRLTAADLTYLRTGERVASVETLDLSGVTLVSSDEPYNTLSSSGALGSTTYYFYIGADSTKQNSSTDGLGQSVNKYHYYSMNLGAAFMNTLYEKVVLPSSVTELGMYSFYGCKMLHTVEVPGGLEAVGRYAFCQDVSLNAIDLSALTWAGEGAFYECTSLASADFSSLDDMGEKAFYGCTALSGTLQLPKLTHVAKYGFAGCTKVTGFEGSELMKTIDDNAFSECSSIAELSLPIGLEEIGACAFQNTEVTSVSFPESVRIIGSNVFHGCKIDTVSFSEGLESIGAEAFYGMPIKHVTFPGSLKYIGGDAFRNSALKSVTFTKSCGSLVIGKGAFMEVQYTTSDLVVNFAEGLESIGQCAFQQCGLTSIDLPEGLKTIGFGAFRSCPSLNEVHLPSTLQEVGDDAFGGTPWANSQTADDDGILYYGTVAVKYKGELTDETVIKPKEGTLGIADWFAYNRSGVTKVELPSTLKVIGYQAFSNTGISSIEFPNSLEQIGWEAFSGTPLTKVTIPENIKMIGQNPFSGCKSLVQVTYNTPNLSNGSLGTIPALSKLIIGSEVSVLPKQFVNTESSLRVTFEDRLEDSELFIGEAALPYNRMTALSLPNCRIALDDNAFSCVKSGDYYTQKASFAFEIPGVITALGKNALRGTGVSGTVRLSDDITNIPDISFSQCKNLKSVVLPDGITTIGDEMFAGCSSLTAISIPDSVKSIGASAFRECSSLATANIGNSVTSIEDYTFYKCSSLTSISIGISMTSIGKDAFYGCKSLEEISFNARNLTDGVLGTFSNLSKITIGSQVSVLPAGFFKSSGQNLVSVNFEDRPEDSELFIGNSALPKTSVLALPNCRLALDMDALRNVKPTFEVPGVIVALGSDAFSWSGVKGNIRLSDEVKSIPSFAFHMCDSLTAVSIPNSVTSIEYAAFSNCNSLTAISIPNSVTNIGYEAFHACRELTSASIGKSVTNIEMEAFSDCNKLADLYCYAESVPEAVNRSFAYIYATCTLHVPEVSINDYKTTLPWSNFSKIVALSAEDGIDMPTVEEESGTYYTLDGRPIGDKPTGRGLYIIGGKKVVIK